MNTGNHTILNRFFTQNVFMELINNNKKKLYETCIDRYITNKDDQMTNEQIISRLYSYLVQNYRNEYFYKNTLINKILIGRYSLNTTTALSEVPTNQSKADFILINGKATVYEIKTELDNFDRLDTQINDYFKAFNNVCVITCESNYKKINEKLKNTNIGINVLTKRNTIKVIKSPVADNSRLEHAAMFKILRKKEFENIIKKHYGDLPITSQVRFYNECFHLFNKIDILLAYNYFLQEVKNRGIKEKAHFEVIPYELKSLAYFSKFKEKDYEKLHSFLNTKLGE